MSLVQVFEGLQHLTPDAQILFIVCLFLIVIYLVTLVAFYPDAARRIEEFIRVCQPRQWNKRIDNKRRKGANR